MLRRMLEQADSVLFPLGISCLLCGEPSYGETVCEACRDALETARLQEPLCPRCGMELGEEGCAFCRERTLPVNGIRSAWRYQDAPMRLVTALKFRGIAAAAEIMAGEMAEAAASLALPPDTLVTWVTMPQKRKRERGIDHGFLLATSLGKALGLPVRQLLLRERRKREHSQRGLNAEERSRNLKGVFRGTGCEGHGVLLADDVFTTGNTIAECSQALLEAGCSGVWAITATRVVRG